MSACCPADYRCKCSTARALQGEVANKPALAQPLCQESTSEAKHKDGRGCYGDQVNGPRVVAFTHKVEVPRVVFVSIDTKVHSGLRLHSDKAPTCLRRISPSPPAWHRIDGRGKRINEPGAPCARALVG